MVPDCKHSNEIAAGQIDYAGSAFLEMDASAVYHALCWRGTTAQPGACVFLLLVLSRDRCMAGLASDVYELSYFSSSQLQRKPHDSSPKKGKHRYRPTALPARFRQTK
ncbi:hypothetical protein BaRGS_00016832 [Batillaria attramentaria]|uniref:Uncharacterized protein n=1 Tax=Batillaria attramentaria TaxID=370345 RepID=A0ABD0KY28_9CAEN